MSRVKRGTVRRAKRKKLLGLAKGYYANKSKLYRAAKESVDTALKYAFVGRRRKKRGTVSETIHCGYITLCAVRIRAARNQEQCERSEGGMLETISTLRQSRTAPVLK